MARVMKDSGIEWIGEIPEGWTLHRMKSCISNRTSGAWGNEAANNEGDIVCLRIADFDYARFCFKDTPLEELTIRNYDKATIDELLLCVGDILIEKSGGGEKTPVGRTVIFDKRYPALFANFMDRLRCSELVTSNWMQYVFVTFYKNNYTKNYIKQTTGIQNLDLTSMLSCERIPVPVISEQNTITAFLDTKCARIDAVIEQTRASIEEYRKLKQSAITQAVTKGIHPGRKMKDSGVEWIGEIPEEWICQKFKCIATVKSNLVQPDDYLDYPQVSPENIEKGSGQLLPCRTVKEVGVISGNHLFFKGQVLYSKIRPKLNKVTIAPFDGLCSADMYPIETKINTEFFVYELRADSFLSQISLITEDRVKMPKINQEELGNIPFAVPPGEEQKEIVSFLNEKCASFDRIIGKKELLIAELESYKKSLIFEYVTGKKEVPV